MALKREYKGISKLRCGPGGWYCQCCNPYRCHPRNMKRLARRLVRRLNRKKVVCESCEL